MVCDAILDCQQTDIATTVPLMNDTQRDGSFENGESTTWTEYGGYTIIFPCDPDVPCGETSGSTSAPHGGWLAWLGGVNANTGGINHLVPLPAGTVFLQLVADVNFETEEILGATALDSFTARITNTGGVELFEIVTRSNQNAAQVGFATWTEDGINVTFDASDWAGGTIKLEFESVTNGSNLTEFFIDDVRLTATVCQ
jgi:hypothetical protein